MPFLSHGPVAVLSLNTVFRLLEVADAKAMSIPHICLVSPDEPVDILKPYEEALPANSELELYGTMFHGWMGARANLEDEENTREFIRG